MICYICSVLKRWRSQFNLPHCTVNWKNGKNLKTKISEVPKAAWQQERSQWWNEVDGVKEEAGSRDKVQHIEKSDQLFAEKMI